MISEIAWLMKAFLQKDSEKIRDMIAERMAEVTENLTAPPPQRPMTIAQQIHNQYEGPPIIAQQSPSMQRIMAQNPDLVPHVAPPVTPAAAQALQARAALIEKSIKEPDQARKSPRKF